MDAAIQKCNDGNYCIGGQGAFIGDSRERLQERFNGSKTFQVASRAQMTSGTFQGVLVGTGSGVPKGDPRGLRSFQESSEAFQGEPKGFQGHTRRSQGRFKRVSRGCQDLWNIAGTPMRPFVESQRLPGTLLIPFKTPPRPWNILGTP